MEGPTVAASSSTAEQASSAATGSKRISTSSSRHAFKVGERVHAKWIQNGSYYPATIKEVRPATGKVLVDWEDGDTIDRTIAICDCFKMEPAAPQNQETIDAACFVQDLPNKGRCLFTRQQLRSGDVVFCEAATLVAIESRHQELWDALVEMHEADAFELGTWSFVYAALLSLLELGPKELQVSVCVVLDKFVPEGENEVISKDVHRIFSEELQFPQKFLKKEHKVAVVKQASGSSSPSSRGAAGGGKTQFQFPGGKQMTKTLVQTLINAWRYNSFGHHTEEGLVLYNRISMCSHACDPSCCWTYGDDDSFVLRARVALEPSAELTISYLQDEDLLKSTSIRREKLENWKFTCGCVRCNLKVDICRGYRCLKCRVGAHYYKENIEDMSYNSTSTSETAQSAQKPAAKRKKLCAADDYYDAPRVKPTTRESTASTAFGRQSQQLYFRDQMLACEARYALAKEEKKSSSSSSAASSFRSRSTGTGGGGGNSSASSSSSSAGKAARGAGAGNLIKANKTSGSSTTSGAVMKGLAGEKPGTPPAGSREKETVRPGDQLTACDVCGEPCTDFAAKQCLNLEPEYVHRIEALEKTNIQDIELVYNATLDFFHEHHWCVFVCEQILSEYYTETKRDVKAAMTHQRNRITFHERVFGRPSFIWAGDLEALADNLQKQIKEQEQKEAAAAASQQSQILGAGGGATTQINANNSPPSSQQSADLLKNPLLKSNKRSSSASTSNNSSPGGLATGVGSPSAASGSKKNTVKKQLSRLSECLAMYRKSQSQYAVLCGASHPYSLSAQNKWHAVQHKINSIANPPTKGTGAGAGTPKPK
eukprot:g1269.t1